MHRLPGLDLKDGDYTVALGDINGGNAQAAVIASAYAFGGDLDNLDPAFDFWTQMAEDGRINTLDILQQNFETGESSGRCYLELHSNSLQEMQISKIQYFRQIFRQMVPS